MAVSYDIDAPGDWGNMRSTPQIETATETLSMSDGCKLFLRSWKTSSRNVLLIMHGMGAHSGWFIDMGNALAACDLSVYLVDYRGFGRSEGLPGHVDRYNIYEEDLVTVIEELRKRHSAEATSPVRFYILGHSMGGIFAAHIAAKYGGLLDGVLFLNPWVKDSARVPLGMTISILLGGLMHSKRLWRAPGGTEGMTLNPEAVKMLEADPYWRRELTANFHVQIFRMRLQVLDLARGITVPALVLQAEQDRTVVSAASRKLYEALGSIDKTWKTYPDFAHDTEFEKEREILDRDIVEWIQARAD